MGGIVWGCRGIFVRNRSNAGAIVSPLIRKNIDRIFPLISAENILSVFFFIVIPEMSRSICYNYCLVLMFRTAGIYQLPVIFLQ